MNESSTPTLASVLYLRLADFARKPVIEQARLRAQLDAVAAALDRLAPVDRLVLDCADGLVVVVLGDAAGALDAAERSLAAAAGLPLCIGINYGPVMLRSDSEAAPGLVGDGIAAAGVAAGIAAPGELRVTRAFRDALAAQAPARGALLRPAGVHSDASIRTHELYAPGPQGAVQRRRRVLGIAAACAVVLVAVMALLRMQNWFAAPATVAFEITPAGEIFVDGDFKGATPPLQQLQLRAGSHHVEVRHGEHPPMQLDLQLEAGQQAVVRHRFAPPGVLVFDIAPGGEVFVDGVSKGKVPTLQRLELLAGRYRVEVRNAAYPPLQLDVNLDSGERVAIRHRFGSSPRPLDKPQQLIRQLRRKLGFD